MGFFANWLKRMDDSLFIQIGDAAICLDGRDVFRYREGDKELRFQADLLIGKPNRVIYPSSIRKWQPPHQDIPITVEDRQRILENICKYFDMGGVTYEIE